ncbi:MAG: M23 family metallopeptidase [Candidatus Pacebacteria bacterium]|nr:M23 family metallopeptidase [Candidatus Paceibacterota bacterium]
MEQEENKVSSLSPIFLIMLTFAIICDLADIFANLFELIVSASIPFVSVFIDLIAAIVIGTWLKRHGATPTKGPASVKKSAEKVKDEGQRVSGVLGKSKAYLKQIIVSFILEQIPFIGGLLPMWTINVISVLKERRTLYLVIAATMIMAPLFIMGFGEMMKPEVCATPNGATTDLSGNGFPVKNPSQEAINRINSPPCYTPGSSQNSGASCPDGGMFGAQRSGGRRHAGLDITVPRGTCPRSIITNPSSAPEACRVYAIKEGKVVLIIKNFFAGTDSVMINHGDYVAHYTEITPLVSMGQEIQSGQHIGNIIANTSGGSAMCHFELYTAGTTNSTQWYGNDVQKPTQLLEPHTFLRSLLNK